MAIHPQFQKLLLSNPFSKCVVAKNILNYLKCYKFYIFDISELWIYYIFQTADLKNIHFFFQIMKIIHALLIF
jgi:hypothetical protein